MAQFSSRRSFDTFKFLAWTGLGSIQLNFPKGPWAVSQSAVDVSDHICGYVVDSAQPCNCDARPNCTKTHKWLHNFPYKRPATSAALGLLLKRAIANKLLTKDFSVPSLQNMEPSIPYTHINSSYFKLKGLWLNIHFS